MLLCMCNWVTTNRVDDKDSLSLCVGLPSTYSTLTYSICVYTYTLNLGCYMVHEIYMKHATSKAWLLDSKLGVPSAGSARKTHNTMYF